MADGNGLRKSCWKDSKVRKFDAVRRGIGGWFARCSLERFATA